MSEEKERLDILLVEKGLFESREKARSSIMAGEIFIDDVRYDKCGERVNKNANIECRGEKLKYVSRGGLKLEKALKSFDIDISDKVCFDIGASTGGFTDCMLQNNAKKVFAIDVGYGQFAWKLRINPRVVCMERKNVRYIKYEDVGQLGSFASIDVSFISLKKIIPPVLDLLSEGGEVVALIKPQFEAGREKVGKKGVVKEKSTHIEVIKDIVDYICSMELKIKGLDFSPIKGPEGNIEYLVYFTKDKSCETSITYEYINDIVERSHENLI